MILVGLTGSIGCGKSTVADMFRAHGAHLLDSDRLAHQALAPESPGAVEVLEHFNAPPHGVDLDDGHGGIDRKRLGALVFRDETARRWLEGVIHPEVRRLQKVALTRIADAEKRAVVVLDIPLLFETGAQGRCDRVVVVCCGEEQGARLAERRNMTPETLKRVISSQMPEAEKMRRADLIIDNRGDLEATRTQVAEVWRDLITLAREGQSTVWPQQW